LNRLDQQPNFGAPPRWISTIVGSYDADGHSQTMLRQFVESEGRLIELHPYEGTTHVLEALFPFILIVDTRSALLIFENAAIDVDVEGVDRGAVLPLIDMLPILSKVRDALMASENPVSAISGPFDGMGLA
jgi:hypothetical protein